MGYQLCKNIVLKPKTNQIFITSASNNVRPITYYKSEYAAKIKCCLEDKILYLMNSLLDGNIQISKLNKNTIPFEYALIKLEDYFRKNNIDEYGKKYDERHELYEKELSKYVNTNEWEELIKFEKENRELVDKIETDINRKLYKTEFEIFKNAIQEEIEGKYYIEDDFGRIIEYLGDTKYGLKYKLYEFPNEDCLMDYKLAYIIKKRMGKNFEIVKYQELQENRSKEDEREEEYE